MTDLDKRIDEIKPCPFCGEAKEIYAYHTEGTILHPHYFMRCESCGLETGGTDKGNHKELWNNRPIESKLQAELAARDVLLKECEELLSRFDVSVLTPISRSMYSDLMYKLITKTEEK